MTMVTMPVVRDRMCDAKALRELRRLKGVTMPVVRDRMCDSKKTPGYSMLTM